jgi:DNA-binding response OmpR family regulator
MTASPLSAFLPCHLLIVDDDPMLIDLAADHFTTVGFTVDCAANGGDALRLMAARLPDLVLCDRLMPEMSGADLLAAVRERGPEWQAMAFVFVTALTDRRDRYAMMPLRPDGYICKPIDFAKADSELSHILQTRRDRSPSPTD